MFIKRCARKYKGKTYESFHIVEAFRDKDKVKHRYIINVTNFTKQQREKILKLLKNPDAKIIDDIDSLFQQGKSYGDIVFFLYQMKNLHLTDILSRYLSKKVLSLTLAVILNRIIKPTSKMEAISWIKKTSFPYFFPLKDKDYHANRVYEAMDEVYDNLDGIMEEFYKLQGEKPTLLIYDITSTCFEGRSVRIAKNGLSRDRRPDRPQVLLGLCLNEKGFPIHFEIFEGNLKDSETLEDILGKVKKRFKIKKSIFVGDRGMITLNNTKIIKGKNLGYILGLRHEKAKDLLRDKDIQPELFDKPLPVTIYQENGKKYVLCSSEERREKDLYVFNQILKEGREALCVVERMVNKGRLKKYDKVVRRAQKKLTESGALRYFDFSYEEGGEFKIIEKKDEIKRAMALCGYYILETSETEMEDEKVEESYKRLKEVERVFRDLKDLINIRPVYHWVERRVKTHIFLCLLAQVVLSTVRKKLKRKGWLGKRKENTLEQFINLLGTIQLGEFSIEGRKILRVQKKNPLKDVLLEIFDLSSFDLVKDRKACSI